ncbi:hypothetical protein HCN44_001989 [Aphidius gifuensis]|uniref:NADH dehydrogenase [ubiquinone] 1 subunit C2 n=1 Tax=Aphidius gifuensis TaxID=684658 RepID=A0A834Y2D6_APHGI|nr:NADH dehydrogenase [ubiquinone] 1 subunit C2 [Aphidius gifuensis]KAF7996357.1 hypothetical protein HCN44_001989 [Aphidius gifuensis]
MTEQEHDISWALKLLEREGSYKENIVAKYSSHALFGAIGLCAPIVANLIYRRPIWAGIHLHVLMGAGGIGVGELLQRRENYVLAKRDAILRDYITRHPEDFPPPKRETYNDVFLEWVPIR